MIRKDCLNMCCQRNLKHAFEDLVVSVPSKAVCREIGARTPSNFVKFGRIDPRSKTLEETLLVVHAGPIEVLFITNDSCCTI